MTSFFFIFRLALASLAAYALIASIVLNGLLPHGAHFEGFVVATASLLGAFAALNAFSHVRRVRLIAGQVNGATLSCRQRRQIEVPFEAGETFDLIDAAIRELPGSEMQESARDSLQVQARVRRPAPYTNTGSPRWHLLNFLEPRPNQILATVTPNGEAGSVTLICEPARTAWTDWFLADHGTNLENAEAVTRAITRRVAQRRRGEQAEARQTVTEKELTVAKLSLLHAQVEPHFLYNTLASAQLLTRSDPARADEMLGNLIEYLRHSLPRTENAMSTIGIELETGARLSRYFENPHGQPAQFADRSAAIPEAGGAAADDVADPGGKRHQARAGAEKRRRHRVDTGARRRGHGGHHGGRRRPGLQRPWRRHRHRPAQCARTAAPDVWRRGPVQHRVEFPRWRGRHHHGAGQLGQRSGIWLTHLANP